MLRCNCCQEVFDDSEAMLWDSAQGWIDVCPKCHGDDLENVEQCQNCKEYFPDEMLIDDFCPECAAKTINAFQKLLAEKFTEEQINFLSHTDCF